MIGRLNYIFIYKIKSLKFYEYDKMIIEYESQKEIF